MPRTCGGVNSVNHGNVLVAQIERNRELKG